MHIRIIHLLKCMDSIWTSNQNRESGKKKLKNILKVCWSWFNYEHYLSWDNVAIELTVKENHGTWAACPAWLTSSLFSSSPSLFSFSFVPSEAANEEPLVDLLLCRGDWEKDLISGLFSMTDSSESESSESSTSWKLCNRKRRPGMDILTRL